MGESVIGAGPVPRPIAAARQTDLLERSGPLAALDDAFSRVSAGSGGRLVLLGGEAGVGKTVLVGRFCDRHRRSARVISGACDALFTPRALGPFLGIADALRGSLGELVRAGARPHEVVDALLDDLRGGKPVILVVEDAHWADQATLDVLRLMGRRIEGAKALVVVTYRDDELGRAHPLRLVLGELPTAGAIVRLPLHPLSPSAVAELARDAEIDAAALHQLTGGNPFFVTEALGAGGTQIPSTVVDAVLARAARMSAAAIAALEAVSIFPGQAEVALLEVIARESIGHLDECVASGMLVPVAGGVSFRHELARLAVEETLAPDRRLGLHRAALRAMETQAGREKDPARLAHHAEAAHDAESVLLHAPAAADRASSLGAHREAAAQFSRALRFAGSAQATLRVRLLEGRAQECYLTGRFVDAIDAEQSALELHRRLGQRRAEGDALRRLSRLRFYAGEVGLARELGRKAVALLERLPPGRELAWAYSTVSMFEERLEEVASWGKRAIELAERIGDDEIRCHSLTNVGCHELLNGIPEGREKLERSLELGMALGSDEAVVRAFSLMAIATVRTRSYDLADDVLTRAIKFSTGRDLASHRLIQLAQRARVELDRGHWDKAVASAEGALRETTEPYRVFALPVIALVRARRGEHGVWPLLDEASELAPADELLRSAPLAAARAEAAWLEGRRDAVFGETQAVFELAVRQRAPWAVGELAAWRRRARIEETIPAELVVEPYVAQFAGDGVRASELWTGIGCPYEAALALADTGAEGPLRQAFNELTKLGARPAAEMVAHRLREMGARAVPRGPRSATRDNPAGLTPREVDVLVLLSEGLRNAEIADRLFLAGKTVDHHVSAILRKLGVRTRGEAAVEAVRLGVVGQHR